MANQDIEELNTISCSCEIANSNEDDGTAEIPLKLTDLTDCELLQLHDWNYNVLTLPSLQDKFRIVRGMFVDTDLYDFLGVKDSVFSHFLSRLAHKYDHRSNPFHNFNHAITVAHGIYYMILQGVPTRCLGVVERFTLLFSALCHDVDHTGRNNIFEANSSSSLFSLYGKQSPLEKHHIAIAIQTSEQCGLFKNLTAQDISTVKKYLTSNILATDMSRHSEIMNEFKSNMPILISAVSPDQVTEQVKLSLSGALVHACDISAPTREFNISREWSLRISQEFSSQLRSEEEKQMPVTTFFQGLDQYIGVAKNEIGFINFFIKPFWMEIQKIGQGKLDLVEININKNIQCWQDEYERELTKQGEQQKQIITA